MKIDVKYDGAYPNLCSGQLIVVVDGEEWVFPSCCLSSGGGVSFDDDLTEHISEGDWSIGSWPEDFPEDMKEAVECAVECAVNSEVGSGCCGGCV